MAGIVCIKRCYVGGQIYDKGDPVRNPGSIDPMYYKWFEGFEAVAAPEPKPAVEEVEEEEVAVEDESLFD